MNELRLLDIKEETHSSQTSSDSTSSLDRDSVEQQANKPNVVILEESTRRHRSSKGSKESSDGSVKRDVPSPSSVRSENNLKKKRNSTRIVSKKRLPRIEVRRATVQFSSSRSF